MPRIVVMGAGIGGMPAAYDLEKALGGGHEVVLVGTSEHFQLTPSNPWVAVAWRKPEQVLVPIRPHRYGIRSIPNFMLFRDGRPVWQQAGLLRHSQLEQAALSQAS